MTEDVIRKTTSICPECLQPIPAEIYVDPKLNLVMMRKTCDDHGFFRDKISVDPIEYKWQNTSFKHLKLFNSGATRVVV